MPENPEVTLEQLKALVDAFNAHDVETIIEAFDDDGEFILAAGPDPWAMRFRGVGEISDALEKRFALVPDIRWTDGKHWIMGGKALSEWRVKGTLPDGRQLDCLGCDLWEFKNGKVTKKDTYYKQVVPG